MLSCIYFRIATEKEIMDSCIWYRCCSDINTVTHRWNLYALIINVIYYTFWAWVDGVYCNFTKIVRILAVTYQNSLQTGFTLSDVRTETSIPYSVVYTWTCCASGIAQSIQRYSSEKQNINVYRSTTNENQPSWHFAVGWF